MKKLLFVFVVGVGIVACGDNSSNETGAGGSIDSNYNSTNPADNTTVQPDTAISGSSNGATRSATGDTNMRKDIRGGTNAESGAATDSGANTRSAGSATEGGSTAGGSGSAGGSGASTNSNNSGSAKDDANGTK